MRRAAGRPSRPAWPSAGPRSASARVRGDLVQEDVEPRLLRPSRVCLSGPVGGHVGAAGPTRRRPLVQELLERRRDGGDRRGRCSPALPAAVEVASSSASPAKPRAARDRGRAPQRRPLRRADVDAADPDVHLRRGAAAGAAAGVAPSAAGAGGGRSGGRLHRRARGGRRTPPTAALRRGRRRRRRGAGAAAAGAAGCGGGPCRRYPLDDDALAHALGAGAGEAGASSRRPHGAGGAGRRRRPCGSRRGRGAPRAGAARCGRRFCAAGGATRASTRTGGGARAPARRARGGRPAPRGARATGSGARRSRGRRRAPARRAGSARRRPALEPGAACDEAPRRSLTSDASSPRSARGTRPARRGPQREHLALAPVVARREHVHLAEQSRARAARARARGTRRVERRREAPAAAGQPTPSDNSACGSPRRQAASACVERRRQLAALGASGRLERAPAAPRRRARSRAPTPPGRRPRGTGTRRASPPPRGRVPLGRVGYRRSGARRRASPTSIVSPQAGHATTQSRRRRTPRAELEQERLAVAEASARTPSASGARAGRAARTAPSSAPSARPARSAPRSSSRSSSSAPASERSPASRGGALSPQRPCGSCRDRVRHVTLAAPRSRLGGLRHVEVALPALVLELDVLDRDRVRVRVQVRQRLVLRDPAAEDLVRDDDLAGLVVTSR